MCHRGFRGPNRGRRVQYLVEGTCPALLSRAPGPTPAATPTGGTHLNTRPELPKPRVSFSNPPAGGPEEEGKVEGRTAGGAGVRSLLRLRQLCRLHSVLVAMKTGHTPAIPARASPVRRRARPSAHEQCSREPASHSLRRQLRRCRCHYGPLQSEGGAAWLGVCGRYPAAGRHRVGVGGRAQILGAEEAKRRRVAGLPAPSFCSGPASSGH